MSPGVSRGIIEALDAGVLTATSVMTTSPWWPESAAALVPFAGRADIGLHLNLTLGAPLGPMPTLAPAGMLPSIGELMRRVRRSDFPTDEVIAEVDRQMDRFQEVWGGPPDHVDGHQHVQALKPLRAVVFTALRSRGWRAWLRDSGDHAPRILRRGATLKKALGLAVLSRGFAADARAQALDVNDGFAGFSPFAENADYGRLFSRYLVAPGQRHLVMCHPGIVDDALRALDPVVATREQELAFLLSKSFTDMLDRRGASLIRLSRTMHNVGEASAAAGH